MCVGACTTAIAIRASVTRMYTVSKSLARFRLQNSVDIIVSTRHAAPHVYSNRKDIPPIDDLTGTEWVTCVCAVTVC